VKTSERVTFIRTAEVICQTTNTNIPETSIYFISYISILFFGGKNISLKLEKTSLQSWIAIALICAPLTLILY